MTRINCGPLPLPRPRRGYADGPWGQIHYQDTGPGPDGNARPLVLLHQSPMTAFQFDAVYAPLARAGYRAIGVDMPGFGLSDPTPDVPTIADYAAILPPLLDALGIARVALLGHHTGGLVTNEAAILWPERIAAVVLNGPLLLTEAERQNFLDTDHVWEKALVAQTRAGHMAELFAIREELAAGTVPLTRISDYIAHTLLGRAPFWWGHYAAYMYRQDERLGLITQPGLILTNTGDLIYETAKKAHTLRPDFAFAALEGGGVDIVDQQPEAWAAAVTAFLDPLPI